MLLKFSKAHIISQSNSPTQFTLNKYLTEPLTFIVYAWILFVVVTCFWLCPKFTKHNFHLLFHSLHRAKHCLFCYGCCVFVFCPYSLLISDCLYAGEKLLQFSFGYKVIIMIEYIGIHWNLGTWIYVRGTHQFSLSLHFSKCTRFSLSFGNFSSTTMTPYNQKEQAREREVKVSLAALFVCVCV